MAVLSTVHNLTLTPIDLHCKCITVNMIMIWVKITFCDSQMQAIKLVPKPAVSFNVPHLRSPISLHDCLCQNKTQHHDKDSRSPYDNIARERAIDQIRRVSIESDRPQLSLAAFISHSDTDADTISSETTITSTGG